MRLGREGTARAPKRGSRSHLGRSAPNLDLLSAPANARRFREEGATVERARMLSRRKISGASGGRATVAAAGTWRSSPASGVRVSAAVPPPSPRPIPTRAHPRPRGMRRLDDRMWRASTAGCLFRPDQVPPRADRHPASGPARAPVAGRKEGRADESTDAAGRTTAHGRARLGAC